MCCKILCMLLIFGRAGYELEEVMFIFVTYYYPNVSYWNGNITVKI